jgi:transposase-like protein
MGGKTYSPERIINKLREAEIHINQGFSIAETSRKIGVTEQTYYRWRREYGGLRMEQARKLKSLEKENARLKKLVADLSLDPGKAWCFTETGMYSTWSGQEDPAAYTTYQG